MTKNLKILFVEDEENIRLSLKEAIGDEFDTFITAKDGNEGLKLFMKESFDLVISDISMPNMNGLDMLTEIRKIKKNMPVILLSAYSDREKLLRAIDVGVNKYLIKPIDPEELLEFVFEIVGEESILALHNGYMFDLKKCALYYNSQIINLTKKELLFVTLLSESAGEIVFKEKLKSAIWQEVSIDDTLLRALVKRFRDKTDKQLIVNCQGLGYKIIKSQ